MKERFISFMLRYQRYVYIAGLVVVLFAVAAPAIMRFMDRRQKYRWDTYTDFGNERLKQPFGTYYFDEYLQEEWKDRYEKCTSMSEAFSKHSKEKCNYLIYDPGNEFFYEVDSINFMNAKIQKGSNIIFTHQMYYPAINLGVYLSNSEFNYFEIKDFSKENNSVYRIPVGVVKASGDRIKDTCWVWNNMINYYLEYNQEKSKNDYSMCDKYYEIPECNTEEVLVDSSGHCLVMTLKMGKGKVLIDGTIFLFHNYSMSQPELWKINKGLIDMTFDKSLPLVVLYKHADNDYDTSGENSMFSVLLKNPPTAWALYILLAMLMLWLIVNSRRRRRAEEILPREHNSSVSYIEHLATLYSMKSDYKELLVIEQRKLLYRFRKEYRFDIGTADFNLPSEYASLVARSKGYDENRIKAALQQLEAFVMTEGTVSRSDYALCMKTLTEAFSK